MTKAKYILSLFVLNAYIVCLPAQENSIVNTYNSPYAKMYPVELDDVNWTEGFWAERFDICQHTMVPHMMGMYMDDSISHAFANFKIAAGMMEGKKSSGPPFHDGDFYKMFEALIAVYAQDKNDELAKEIDSIIYVIGSTQREDGYIHTPVVIKEKNDTTGKEFGERLDFETYNMGHLMTAACLHYRITGKTNFLDIAKKATDFLYEYYKNKPFELAQNAICPSHYMGVTEMYRTTKDERYLELAKGLIDIRALVTDGTDHNQDRIPFRHQTEAIGHAVRANYLYAGVADVYTETGDDSLFAALDAIWHDLIERKMYITGGCGALYDGVSPNGTSYNPKIIQQVHQAYGQDYELPNIDAHNESCANIGNLLWNWRMLQSTADAKYADVMEQVMYNSLLAGVSLDGTGYFYTNPLAYSQDLPFELRWSKQREPYISYCNCCPPNTIRTIAEIDNYMYSIGDDGIYVNFYGGNSLSTELRDGSEIKLTQVSDYPWGGLVKITINKTPKKEYSYKLRIPAWCDNASIRVNDKPVEVQVKPGEYVAIDRKWAKGDVIILDMPMKASLVVTNPLVEDNRNQVAVQYGPVVYCLEGIDIPEGNKVWDISIPLNAEFAPQKEKVGESTILFLTGKVLITENKDWTNELYRKINNASTKETEVKLIPYYAWGNRGKTEMTVWLPLTH